jgi:microcystin-dependent protein
MASYPNQQLTNGGWDALADALAGQRLKFMRMSVGSGEMTPGEDLAERTDLINHVMDIPIIDYRPAGEGKVIITGALRSSDVETGFFLREIGLWVTLTPLPEGSTEGPPILYSINNTGEEGPDYIPAKGEATVVIHTIEVQVLISKAAHVEVVVILAEVYLTGENIGEDTDQPGVWHPAGLFKERIANRMRYRRLIPQPGLLKLNIDEQLDHIDFSITAGTENGTGGSTGGQGAGVVVTGTLLPFVGVDPPFGYLMADGRAVSRTDFPGLFAVCGTRFGPGDGVTTFNLPDAQGRTLVGAGALNDEPSWGLQLGERQGVRNMQLVVENLPWHAHAVDIQHNHGTIVTGNHNHGDPGHLHAASFWHGHGLADPQHSHWQNSWPRSLQPGAVPSVEVFEGPMTQDYPAYTGIVIAANWASGNTDVRGCGLHDAGNLGGYTGWVDNPGRTTSGVGESRGFSLLQPSLGVNYIIKT